MCVGTRVAIWHVARGLTPSAPPLPPSRLCRVPLAIPAPLEPHLVPSSVCQPSLLETLTLTSYSFNYDRKAQGHSALPGACTSSQVGLIPAPCRDLHIFHLASRLSVLSQRTASPHTSFRKREPSDTEALTPRHEACKPGHVHVPPATS